MSTPRKKLSFRVSTGLLAASVSMGAACDRAAQPTAEPAPPLRVNVRAQDPDLGPGAASDPPPVPEDAPEPEINVNPGPPQTPDPERLFKEQPPTNVGRPYPPQIELTTLPNPEPSPAPKVKPKPEPKPELKPAPVIRVNPGPPGPRPDTTSLKKQE